jgi:predicted DsbA family dithiol-disulfide isomerase
LANKAEGKDAPKEKESDTDDRIEIVMFKSDACAFCPQAEDVLRDAIDDFGPDIFKLRFIDVKEDPDAAEEYGVFALPTIMIGGVAVTGIPEPEMIMKMVLGAKVALKKGEK